VVLGPLLVDAIGNPRFVEVRRFEGKFGIRRQWANRVAVTRDGRFVVDSRQCVTTGKDGFVRLWEWKK